MPVSGPASVLHSALYRPADLLSYFWPTLSLHHPHPYRKMKPIGFQHTSFADKDYAGSGGTNLITARPSVATCCHRVAVPVPAAPLPAVRLTRNAPLPVDPSRTTAWGSWITDRWTSWSMVTSYSQREQTTAVLLPHGQSHGTGASSAVFRSPGDAEWVM